jgi:hypothetical protein
MPKQPTWLQDTSLVARAARAAVSPSSRRVLCSPTALAVSRKAALKEALSFAAAQRQLEPTNLGNNYDKGGH